MIIMIIAFRFGLDVMANSVVPVIIIAEHKAIGRTICALALQAKLKDLLINEKIICHLKTAQRMTAFLPRSLRIIYLSIS